MKTEKPNQRNIMRELLRGHEFWREEWIINLGYNLSPTTDNTHNLGRLLFKFWWAGARRGKWVSGYHRRGGRIEARPLGSVRDAHQSSCNIPKDSFRQVGWGQFHGGKFLLSVKRLTRVRKIRPKDQIVVWGQLLWTCTHFLYFLTKKCVKLLTD